ncbi:MAG: InlB B-repeat-containing protein [Clostridiales bacterium]|nr:InlB B-repeat-containing protein [Clostridiales bacterium]
MKKLLAILLALMLIMSSAIAVNAESIKDIFGKNNSDVTELSHSGIIDLSPHGADANFTINKVTYSALFNKVSSGKFCTAYVNNKSTNDSDYDLTIQLTIKASAAATSGNLIVPLDDVYNTSGSVSTSTKPYFKNFKYKVGDGSVTSTTVKNGPVSGIDKTNHYLSIPLSSPDTAETNLNAYIYCVFELEHVGLVKKDQPLFDTYYTTIGNTVSTSLSSPLVSSNDGFLNQDPWVRQDSYIKSGYIYRDYETQYISDEIVQTAYQNNSDSDGSYTQIPLVDTDDAFTAVVQISPGVQVELREPDSHTTLTGNITQGYKLVIKYGNTKALNVGRYYTSNRQGLGYYYMAFSRLKIFVPANQSIDEIKFTTQVTARTKQGIETRNGERTLIVLDPIQDLNDDAYKLKYDHLCLDLNNPSSSNTNFSNYTDRIENVGILPISGVSYTWQNDTRSSGIPANVSQIVNRFNSSYGADFKVYIKSRTSSRTLEFNLPSRGVGCSVSYTDSTNARHIKLNEGEWVDKVVSTPYYTENGTKISGVIKGDVHDIVDGDYAPIVCTYILPPNKKSLQTNNGINNGDYTQVSGILRYEPHYTYNGNARVDTVGSDSDSSGVITRTNKLYYVTGEAAHNAYIQVTENSNISLAAPSGSETKNINSCLYLFNALYNSMYASDRPTYSGEVSANWVGPVATVVFPKGIKLNTSAVTNAGTNKYTTTSGTHTITITKLANDGEKEVWRFNFDASTIIKRYDTNGRYTPSIRDGYVEGVNVPLTVTSDALGGAQLFDIYTSASNDTPFIPSNSGCYSTGSSVSNFLDNPKSFTLVTDANDYDGDGSRTDKVVKIEKVKGFTVNASYQIDGKSQYKKNGVTFTDVDSDAIPVNIGTDADFRVILTNAGNAIVTDMKVIDAFPNFYSGASTYVPNSLIVEILDTNNNVVKTITNAQISGTTTLSVILPAEEELYPGFSLQLTGKFKVRDDARPNIESNSKITLESKFDNSNKRSVFNQLYRSEDATMDLRINVFLDYNYNGTYESSIDKALSSARVNTKMTTSDDSQFNDTKTLTNSVSIDYSDVEYGKYTTSVSNIKDEHNHSLDSVSKTFEITLEETRAGGTKIVNIPVTPKYIGELYVKYILDNQDVILYSSDSDQIAVPTGTKRVYYDESILGSTKYVLKDGEPSSKIYSLTLQDPIADILFTVVPVDYTVTYVGNGGKTADNQTTLSETHGYNTTVNVKPGTTFTRTGYYFDGWTASGITLADGATTFSMPDGNVTLTAKWGACSYTVWFNANGHGTPSMNSKQVVYDSPYGPLATISAPGYTFGGWYLNSECTGDEIKSTTIVAIAGGHTLYAKWTIINYTIGYNLNGGEVAVENPTQYNVETPTFTINNPTKTGYDFTGWTGTGLSGATETVTIEKGSTGERSYIANWEASQYTVTFDANGHGTPDPASKTVKYDSAYGPLATISETGYTFGGWYMNADCTGDEIKAETIVKTPNDHTLYAKWTPNQYTIVFDGNGSTSGEMTDQDFTYDEEQKLNKNEYERTGYTFDGWKDDEGNKYEDEQTIKNLTPEDGAKITLKVDWKANEYKVTFDANGHGTPSMESKTVVFDSKYGELATISEEGYVFGGWYLNAECTGNAITDQSIVKTAGDHTLYAKWSLAIFKVIYDGNDGTIGTKKSYEKNAEYKSIVTVDTNNFENTGYVFIEWNTKADGTGTIYDEANTFEMPAHDVTLYAQWEKAGFYITYKGNGGLDKDSKDTVEKPHLSNMPAEIAANMFERKGYEFLGWSKEQITKEINDKNINEIDINSFYQPGDFYLDGESITLYAVWKKIDDGSYMDVSDTDKNTDTTGPHDGSDTSTEKDTEDSEEPVPSKPLYGDVDCNGKVTMEDVVALQKIMAKLATHEEYGEMSRINSDCVHDDVINMMDVTEIQKFLAKLIPDLDP